MSEKPYREATFASSFLRRGRSLDRPARWADLKVGPYDNGPGGISARNNRRRAAKT